ncbi:zinc ribbon domain-containing protein [Comamonas nitrativorans]|uniref:Zinc ribbon domain-containing protein n=1 Tax=Comamonas nitrativorans TaxID=108437 RepID=A0ABV9GV83_9BURK
MSTLFCTQCGQQIAAADRHCPHCGAAQTAVVPPAAPGKKAVPDGIRGWSWGAFLLSWVWAIGNKTWIGLLALIPYVGLIMAIVLGIKGREWAWQNKEWDSVEHFQRVQKQWNRWAFIIIGALIVIGGAIGVGVAIYENRAQNSVPDEVLDMLAQTPSTPSPPAAPRSVPILEASQPHTASIQKYEPLFLSENETGQLFQISSYPKNIIYKNTNLLDYLFEDTDMIGYLGFEKIYQFGKNYIFIISTGENGKICPATTYAFQVDTAADSISDKHKIDGCSENVETFSEGNKLMVKKEGDASIFYNGEVR